MSSIEITEPRPLRKANDVFASGVPEPTYLFDEFWREGEVALLFGPHGVGKSFLAVEIAEALARGRPVKGLMMPETRRNVLYVDLVLSDKQFGYRYSWPGRRDRRSYKFSANLHRDYPCQGEDLIEWLRVKVERHKVDVIVIDDLSLVSHTDDGTQRVLELVRELRLMARIKGISSLVLADSHPYIYGREAAERDLRRRRVLCSHADSVFALSANGNGVRRKLVQTRAQSDDIAWPQGSPAHFRLRTRDDGFVGFDLVEAPLASEEREMICRIKSMRDDAEKPRSFRGIADELDISKSRAARLYAKWKPSLEVKPGPAADGPDTVIFDQYESDEIDIFGFDREGEYHWSGDATRNPEAAAEAVALGRWLPEHVVEHVAALANAAGETPHGVLPERFPDNDTEDVGSMPVEVPCGPNSSPERGITTRATVISEPPWSQMPFAAALRRRSILELERGVDHNGVPIFIESRREHDGKPKVWYQYNPKSQTYTRWERTTFTTRGKNIGRSPYLSRDTPLCLSTRPRGQPNS